MNKNKKIVIIVNDLNFFISHRLPIAEALLHKGFKVSIGYGHLGEVDIQQLEQKGFSLSFIPLHRGSINLFKEIKTFFFIWKFIAKEKPILAHFVTIKPYLYGGIVSRIKGVKCVVSAVSGLGSLFINNKLKIKFLRFILFILFKIALKHNNQKVIFHNQEDLRYLVSWGVLNKKKANIIKGSGVKLKDFTNLDEPKGTPVICFAARLLRDKGIYEYFLAAKLLKQRGIKAEFLIVGDLDTKNPSGLNKSELNNLKNEKIVKILGYEKDIPKLYARSNIICLPSYREGLPKSLIEAAAASRAVVTTDVPGCRDAIIPNRTGILVPVRDYQKLADALQWLIENPKERKSMGKEGRKFAEKEFPIETIVQKHIDIYQELIEKVIIYS